MNCQIPITATAIAAVVTVQLIFSLSGRFHCVWLIETNRCSHTQPSARMD